MTDAVNAAATPPPTHRPEIDRTDPLWGQAVKLEALLFQQLLDVSGVGGLGTGDPDGPGSRFDSFLREQHAQAIAGTGTTGLAESLYRSLQADLGR